LIDAEEGNGYSAVGKMRNGNDSEIVSATQYGEHETELLKK